MQREQRLRRPADFAAVYNRGRASSGAMLVVKVRPNGLAVSRFGFAVGKKLGGAVVRNLIKRRLRAISDSLPTRGGWDVILIARAPAVPATFPELRAETLNLFRRAKLLQTAPAPTAAPSEALP